MFVCIKFARILIKNVIFRLSAFGYLCYLPDFHRLMIRTESEYMPSGITTLNPRYISFIVIFSLCVSIISKVCIHDSTYKLILSHLKIITHKEIIVF